MNVKGMYVHMIAPILMADSSVNVTMAMN